MNKKKFKILKLLYLDSKYIYIFINLNCLMMIIQKEEIASLQLLKCINNKLKENFQHYY